ncbi:MAG: prolipoprotein diacylglyceryl transferase [Deltaproteobacteria bacterium]|nr:prolipoprotein diacylglyceryl transferase [Deltaproteobacteria bacterium]
MHPILLNFGDIKIYTYGVAMALSFTIAIYLALKRTEKEKKNPIITLDLSFWVLISSILGARILFILTRWDEYLQYPMEIFKIWKGGLVYYGGLIGAVIGGWIYLRTKRAPGFVYLDIIAPYAALGLAIHRALGCFVGTGCCYGKPTEAPWGVTFPSGSPAAAAFGPNVSVHPTQLYESLNGLVIFLFLKWFARYKKIIHGEETALFFMIYSVNRFVIEFFRGDKIRGSVGFLSTSQFISALMFVTGVGLFWWLRTQKTKGPAAA